MAVWAAVLDGINDRATIASVTTSNNIDVEAVITFNSLNGGAILSDGGVANFFRYNAGTLRFRCLGFLGSSMSFTPVIGQKYTLGAALRPTGVELFVDGSSIGTSNGSPTGMLINTIGFFNSSFYLGCAIERLTVTDNTAPSNSFDLYNDVVAGSSVDWKDQTANARNGTLVDTATDGSQWLEVGGGGGGVSGDVVFEIPVVEFSTSGSATLPKPSGDISFDIPSIEFNGAASATFPSPSGDISFDVISIEFTATGSATQPNPNGNASFDISPIEFSVTGGASLPFPVGDVSFDVEAIEFSVTGTATIPFPVGNIAFDMPIVGFSGTGSTTQPEPSGDISFIIEAIEFSGVGSATGATLPTGEIIMPTTQSNVIIVNTKSNLIKL